MYTLRVKVLMMQSYTAHDSVVTKLSVTYV